MTNKEIRKKIDANNKEIEKLLTPNIFILNNNVAKLIEENKNLQKECIHQFENGYCNYCDIKEGKNAD